MLPISPLWKDKAKSHWQEEEVEPARGISHEGEVFRIWQGNWTFRGAGWHENTFSFVWLGKAGLWKQQKRQDEVLAGTGPEIWCTESSHLDFKCHFFLRGWDVHPEFPSKDVQGLGQVPFFDLDYKIKWTLMTLCIIPLQPASLMSCPLVFVLRGPAEPW